MLLKVAKLEEEDYQETRRLNHQLFIPVPGVVQSNEMPDTINDHTDSNLVPVFASPILEDDVVSAPDTDDKTLYPELVLFDGADEFRISIQGRFAGTSVDLVRQTWTHHLAGHGSVGVTVDISAISDYDEAGRRLLREMFCHGIKFAAANSASLCFLSEISSSRRADVTMLPRRSGEPVGPNVGAVSGALIL